MHLPLPLKLPFWLQLPSLCASRFCVCVCVDFWTVLTSADHTHLYKARRQCSQTSLLRRSKATTRSCPITRTEMAIHQMMTMTMSDCLLVLHATGKWMRNIGCDCAVYARADFPLLCEVSCCRIEAAEGARESPTGLVLPLRSCRAFRLRSKE